MEATVPQPAPDARDQVIDDWIAGYVRFRVPFDRAYLDRVAGLPVARFPVPARPVDEEVFVRAPSPAEDVARADSLGPHWITAFEPSDGAGADYAPFGYRFVVPEYLMACALDRWPARAPDVPVRRVTDPRLAQELSAIAGSAAFTPAHIADPAVTLLAIFDGARPAAWGANVWPDAGAPYVTRIFTHPDYRRRGLARHVVAALLDEARARDAARSVLSATELARTLYPQLGYRELATIRIWRSPHQRED